MNILLINTDQAKIYPKMFEKYLNKMGYNCYSSSWRREDIFSVISSKKLSPLNTLIYARTAGPHITKTYKELEKKGFRVINKSFATELTSNKYNSQIFAKKNSIPVASTYKINKKEIKKIQELSKKHGFVIAKPIFSKGQGLFCKKISQKSSVKEITELIFDIPGNDIIVQEKVEYTKLIRVIVVGFKVLREASTYDSPTKNNWKASVCMNKNIKKYDLVDDRLIKLAEKTAKKFDCGISFIDFFEDQGGNFILNELNTACGLIIHEKISGLKIHERISDYLIEEVSKIRAS